MKKRILASLLVVCMVFIAGCSCTTATKENVATIPAPTKSRQALENAQALMISQYIVATLYTQKLESYDYSKANVQEVSELLENTKNAYLKCQDTSTKVEKMANDYQQFLDKKAVKTLSKYKSLNNNDSNNSSFEAGNNLTHNEVIAQITDVVAMSKVNAAEEKSAKELAEEITKIYDSYPAGKQVKGLAASLGVDAKTAYETLQQAQDVIRNNAMADAAFYDTCYKAAKATKTGCKVACYVGGVYISAGNLMTLTEAGGFLLTSTDVLVETLDTGANLILGENSKAVQYTSKMQQAIAPISAVTGFMTLNISNLEESVCTTSYITDQVVDFIENGNILGGIFKVGKKDSKTDTNAQEIELKNIDINKDSTIEDAANALLDAGFDKESVDAAIKKGEDVEKSGKSEEELIKLSSLSVSTLDDMINTYNSYVKDLDINELMKQFQDALASEEGENVSENDASNNTDDNSNDNSTSDTKASENNEQDKSIPTKAEMLNHNFRVNMKASYGENVLDDTNVLPLNDEDLAFYDESTGKCSMNNGSVIANLQFKKDSNGQISFSGTLTGVNVEASGTTTGIMVD